MLGIDKFLTHLIEKIDPTVRNIIDGAAASVSIGGFFLVEHMNFLVLALTFIWTGVRIWETETVKKLTGRWEDKDE